MKNEEDFKHLPFVHELLKHRLTGKKIRLFAQDLNSFLKDKKFREKYGFEKDHLSIKECISLVTFIQKPQSKPNFVIRKIDEVPEEMLKEFGFAAGFGTVNKINRAKHNFGAFVNDKLIGFISARYFREGNELDVLGLYVEGNYRGFGLATRLVYTIIREAWRMNLRGVQLNEMVFETKWLMEKMLRRLQTQQKPLWTIQFSEDENFGFCAEVCFIKRRKQE